MHLVDNPEAPNQGNEEPLAPVVHFINFKTRRALMCRGESAQADALARGFKKVTVNQFVKYIAEPRRVSARRGARSDE